MGTTRELLEGFTSAIAGDAAALGRVAGNDIEFHDSLQTLRGLDAVASYLQAWANAFPDARIEITNVMESDTQAASEIVYRGTHTGPLASPQGTVAATGRTVNLAGSAWITVRNGRVSSFRGYYDTATMMVQLGVAVQPAGTAG